MSLDEMTIRQVVDRASAMLPDDSEEAMVDIEDDVGGSDDKGYYVRVEVSRVFDFDGESLFTGEFRLRE